MFWVIYLNETDGKIILWPCKTIEDAKEYVTLEKLHILDYAIIEGLLTKDFNKYTFNN